MAMTSNQEPTQSDPNQFGGGSISAAKKTTKLSRGWQDFKHAFAVGFGVRKDVDTVGRIQSGNKNVASVAEDVGFLGGAVSQFVAGKGVGKAKDLATQAKNLPKAKNLVQQIPKAGRYIYKSAENLAVGIGVSKGVSAGIVATDKGEFKKSDAVKEATIAGFNAQAEAKQTRLGRTAESMIAFTGSKSAFQEGAKQSLQERGFSGAELDSALSSAMKRRTAKGSGEFAGLVAQAGHTERVVGPVIKKVVQNKGFWQSTIKSAPILAVAGAVEGGGAGAIQSESRQGKVDLQTVKQGAIGGAISAPALGAPIIGFAMRSNKLQGLAKQSFVDNSFKDATKFTKKASTSKKISNTLLGSAYVGDIPEAFGDVIEGAVSKASRKKMLPNVVKTPSLSSVMNPTQTKTNTPTPSVTPSPSLTPTPSKTKTSSFVFTPTPSPVPTPSKTPTSPIATPTPNPSPSPTDTFTPTFSPTQTTTKTTSFTPTMVNTPTPTPQGIGFFPPLGMFGNAPKRGSQAKGKKVIRNVKTLEQLIFG